MATTGFSKTAEMWPLMDRFGPRKSKADTGKVTLRSLASVRVGLDFRLEIVAAVHESGTKRP
jgi:hypothetical protein